MAPAPAFVRRVWFGGGAYGEPLSRPSSVPAAFGPVYAWRGRPLWLMVELDPAALASGQRLCARWLDPAGRTATLSCEDADELLAFPSPDNREWAAGIYRVRLELELRDPEPPGEDAAAAAAAAGSGMRMLGTVRYGLGTRPPAALARSSPPTAATAPAAANGDAVPRDGTPAFAWPPPRPTSRAIVDRRLLAPDSGTLGQAADRLAAALRRVGYLDRSFYSVPGGFAMVTQLEQIEPDGTPKPEPLRWSSRLPPRRVFSLEGFIQALFTAPEGHYRVIVFVVNDRPFATAAETASRDDALAWLGGGLDRLPDAIAARPAVGHGCTALVYQFRKVGHSAPAVANPDGAPAAELQLARSGILAALGG